MMSGIVLDRKKLRLFQGTVMTFCRNEEYGENIKQHKTVRSRESNGYRETRR
jgi:hypothetical protein